MITKRHIKQFLNDLLDGSTEQQTTGAIWHAFHDYILRYYRRLDTNARSFADRVFDDLDMQVQAWIDGLPQGREKKRLLRKFAMIKGHRSPIPIVYLDTPVLDAFIRYGLGEKLSVGCLSIERLYEQMRNLAAKTRILCPEDVFHREVLQETGDRFKPGLDLIHLLSDGHCFHHGQTIEDFQVFRAIHAFAQGSVPVDYRKFWKDAFPKKTVQAIYDKRSTVAFHTDFILPYGVDQHCGYTTRGVRLKIRYDFDALNQERQLQKRSARHLRDLVRLGLKYEAVTHDPGKGFSQRHLDGFWEGQKMDLPIALWNSFGAMPDGIEGLVGFFESDCFRTIPSLSLKRDVWNVFSSDKNSPFSRAAGPSEIAAISSVLPYSDLMILGPNMTRVVRDHLGLDVLFDTEIYSLEEGDRLMVALSEVTNAD